MGGLGETHTFIHLEAYADFPQENVLNVLTVTQFYIFRVYLLQVNFKMY